MNVSIIVTPTKLHVFMAIYHLDVSY